MARWGGFRVGELVITFSSGYGRFGSLDIRGESQMQRDSLYEDLTRISSSGDVKLGRADLRYES